VANPGLSRRGIARHSIGNAALAGAFVSWNGSNYYPEASSCYAGAYQPAQAGVTDGYGHHTTRRGQPGMEQHRSCGLLDSIRNGFGKLPVYARRAYRRGNHLGLDIRSSPLLSRDGLERLRLSVRGIKRSHPDTELAHQALDLRRPASHRVGGITRSPSRTPGTAHRAPGRRGRSRRRSGPTGRVVGPAATATL
jgi:hypothetical protein